ncbi:CDP-glycerol glycerophosphotransferase family protein [Kribbella swartbergensis]
MRIVYNSFGGRYCDNPRAIYETLVQRAPGSEHIWTCSPAHEHNFPAGVELVEFGGAECVAALESADLLISNDHVPLDWDKRPETSYLQTWHGTPLKRIHHDVLWAPEGRLAQLDHDVARWDRLLSPNSVSTQRLRRAFGFTGPIHETGYPRNDLLSSPDQAAVRRDVRAQLGVPGGKTAVLYTPTWRDDLVFGEGPGLRLAMDLHEFTRRLGDDHVLLLRLHSLVSDRVEVPPGAPIVDVSAYRDVRELYAAADLLVTDYSSTMFDFAVTGRPILLFTYDLEDYRDRLRGFYFDLAAQAAGPLLRTDGELFDAIADIDSIAASHRAAYAEFRAVFCHLDDGHATERVLDLLFPSAGRGTSPAVQGEFS